MGRDLIHPAVYIYIDNAACRAANAGKRLDKTPQIGIETVQNELYHSIGGAKVYNLGGGLKGRGRVSDRSFTHHAPVLWLSPPRHANIWGAQPPKPVIRAAYAIPVSKQHFASLSLKLVEFRFTRRDHIVLFLVIVLILKMFAQFLIELYHTTYSVCLGEAYCMSSVDMSICRVQ